MSYKEKTTYGSTRRSPLYSHGPVVLIFLLCIMVCSSIDSHAGNILGGVNVTGDEVRKPLPDQPPGIIYISDFALYAKEHSEDEGVSGALPGRLGKRMPHPLARGESAEKAFHIVEDMAESLVQNLVERGMTARRLSDASGDLPVDGWLVQGVFTEVDEGNRIRRAVIGFGRGSSSMDLQIGISNLASSEPRAPFLIIGTTKDPNMIPGAIVTMNPYVAAAKFVLAKNAAPKDIKKTAALIADEIIKYARPEQAKPADR